MAAEIRVTELKPEYEKAIKDPYVMEFLQIKPGPHVYERKLEQVKISRVISFLVINLRKRLLH